MVVSSSAMSQSIVSSIIVRLRRITGIACCRAANEDEGTVQDAAPPASSNNGVRSANAPPRSKAAGRRAIGKPTSCCSPDAARRCWFSTNDKPASASFSTPSIEKLSSPPGPSLVNSANFHRRYAKPLEVGDDGTERVAVIGIAVQGLGMQHELPPLGAVAGVAIETLQPNS